MAATEQQVNNLSRGALERLARDNLQPTPENYAVYFRYLSNDTPGLNAAFDAAVGAGAITQEQCTQIYAKFLSNNTSADFLQSASHAIDAELKKVLDLISVSAKDTHKFGADLDSFSGKLSGENSAEVLRDAIVKIAAETKHVTAQNQKLQIELETTTKQLGDMRADFDRVHKEAQIDGLTGVGNRKFFEREVAVKLAEATGENANLSLLMVDVDHFKKFNDTHGHLLGDQVLTLVAKTLVENLKGRDVIARFGGEEFVILLPQTRLQDAERVGNQLRSSLESKRIRKRGSQQDLGAVTVSIGAAQFTAGEDRDALIARADAALYKAKQTGRNCVVCLLAGETPPQH